jgi:hypothetical protein
MIMRIANLSRFNLRHVLIFVAISAFVLALPGLYLRIPGTLYFDSSGRAHGTGLKQYFYDSGKLMIDEKYSSGEMTRSVWYRPDGSVVADVKVPAKTESFVGYYLNQNGTIKVKMTYRFKSIDRTWVADGPCEKFDADGNPIGIETYRDGKLVSE